MLKQMVVSFFSSLVISLTLGHIASFADLSMNSMHSNAAQVFSKLFYFSIVILALTRCVWATFTINSHTTPTELLNVSLNELDSGTLDAVTLGFVFSDPKTTVASAIARIRFTAVYILEDGFLYLDEKGEDVAFLSTDNSDPDAVGIEDYELCTKERAIADAKNNKSNYIPEISNLQDKLILYATAVIDIMNNKPVLQKQGGNV